MIPFAMNEALKNLIYRVADDELILGHRNSEWTGLGPVLEEDIAFSSMAQDKIGHAWALYKILQEHFGESEPDSIAFLRNEKDFTCCQFVELPIGEYDFSLVRHFLFDHAEYQRYQLFLDSTFEPLAQLAKKVKGELKYHVLHGDTWMKKLSKGPEESKARMQSALNEALPYALGIFEPGDFEEELKEQGIFAGEEALQQRWLEAITPIIETAGLELPAIENVEPIYGGRKGYHTEHLQPLLEEMGEVIRSQPNAAW